MLVLSWMGGREGGGGHERGGRRVRDERRLRRKHAEQPAYTLPNPRGCSGLALSKRASTDVQEVIGAVLCDCREGRVGRQQRTTGIHQHSGFRFYYICTSLGVAVAAEASFGANGCGNMCVAPCKRARDHACFDLGVDELETEDEGGRRWAAEETRGLETGSGIEWATHH